MIRKWNDYESTKSYADYERLPKGGYVVKILGVSVEHYRDNESTLKLSCDVCEGDYANFYADAYKSNSNEDKRWGCNYLINIPNDDGSERDGWRKRGFKTAIEAIEESNPGYHWGWNETTLKGLTVGALFNEREYEAQDGSIRKSTNLARFISADKIRSGSFTLPKDKLIERSAPASAPGSGWMDVPDNDDGLPFN